MLNAVFSYRLSLGVTNNALKLCGYGVGRHFSLASSSSSTTPSAGRGRTNSSKLKKPLPKTRKVNPAIPISTAPSAPGTHGFAELGLMPEMATALAAQKIVEPTPVQASVISRLLNKDNIVMAASTGSGKTLAYTLPAIQNLIKQEKEEGYMRLEKRPRCLILVPTRELARQVLQEVKQISHYCKISSAAILGGESYEIQKNSLCRPVDLVVASPGRLMQHKEKGNVMFNKVNTIIIDEVDTMLTQGFGNDIRAILKTVLSRTESTDLSSRKEKLHLVMATATLTNAVRKLLTDVEHGGFNVDYTDPGSSQGQPPQKPLRSGAQRAIKMEVVEVDGVHRSLPNVQHLVEMTKGADKLIVLKNVLNRYQNKKYHTLIFCNTVNSARAVDYALNDGIGSRAVSYHGELNSKDREVNLEKFRNGEEQYLVCTDIAARGLDIPSVHHVVLFDFPLNPIDYLHRAGRCGRAGKKGMVTSIVTKRDVVLSDAIQRAIANGEPIDSLSSSKRDYKEQYPAAAAKPVMPHHTISTDSKSSKPLPKPLVTRKNALVSTSSPSAKGADFAAGKGARVITRGGKRSVKLNRPVNKLGQKLSLKKTLRPGVKKMFPDSTRPLRREIQNENFRKTKYGSGGSSSAVGIKSNTVDGSGHYSRDEMKGRKNSVPKGGKRAKSVRTEVRKAVKSSRGGGSGEREKRSKR